ncbi:GNAT family N-acetyltransferase [Methanoplanus limicola]|uniref:GCN5-related N-acetyltransferase n=1 Tax=Methanoplanus limicola DSM 2279 TaxID=937775 RepID=H1YYC0_9EURY|nr:GNAT family N-acetyltransferase [Methanoplanus limicola]EHQ34215.1 GCN5-related N-acetyltransferase [Methanoplanus limicola DSM 2279]
MELPDNIPKEQLIFSFLSKKDKLSGFDCSESELNEFLVQDALDNQIRKFSVTRLLYWNNNITGYFTLVNDCISIDNLENVDRQDDIIYRKYPALKIARLATDKNFENKGIGTHMVDEIFYIAFKISNSVGCRILTVDSKQNSVTFYQKFGFKRATNSRRETIPMYLDFHSALKQE